PHQGRAQDRLLPRPPRHRSWQIRRPPRLRPIPPPPNLRRDLVTNRATARNFLIAIGVRRYRKGIHATENIERDCSACDVAVGRDSLYRDSRISETGEGFSRSNGCGCLWLLSRL